MIAGMIKIISHSQQEPPELKSWGGDRSPGDYSFLIPHNRKSKISALFFVKKYDF